MPEANGALIKLDGVTKVFYTDEVETHALSRIHLEITQGEYLAICGPVRMWQIHVAFAHWPA